MDGVLARFGEIGIKSAPVRRMMQSRLRQNMIDMMLREGVEGNVESLGARLWMVGDVPRLLDVARRTFGIVSASPMRRCGSSMEALKETAASVAMEKEWTSFAVRARRHGKHGFSSQDVGIQVGSAIYEAAEAAGRTPRVDLDTPDLEVFIEVRGEGSWIGVETVQGPGGLPLGSQGKVAVLLSDTNSAVAAWFMMRRGCKVVPIHAGDMGSAPLELIEPLQQWGLGTKVDVLPVCSRAVTKEHLVDAATTIAKRAGASVLVTGDTLDSRLVAGDLPVLRPLCGLEPAHVTRLVEMIGLPDEDGPDLLVDDGGDLPAELLRLHQAVTV